MSSNEYVIKSSMLIMIIISSLLIGGLVGGIIGYNAAPSGGQDFDLPDIGTFRMGFLPSQPGDVDEVTSDATELMNFLSEEMGLDEQGIDVEVYPVQNGYEELILAFQNGQIDAAFMDATPAYIAVKQGLAEVALAEVQNQTQATFYNAAAWVKQDSPITSLDILTNGSFVSSHTSWTGTSGMIIPTGSMIADGYMDATGINTTEELLQRHFADYVVGGGYGEAMRRLMDDQADVAYVRGTLDNLSDELQSRAGEVRRLHVFGKAPSHPIIVNKDLPEGWKIKFIQAMLELNEGDNIDIIQQLYGAVIGLVATSNYHLSDIGTALDNMPWVTSNYIE